ncbi:hypothetical protein [Clostridium estertheticum]|uniref:hypothetical protein n=1 Tax=Clostridium estertheticum TaxID=238834 RepID=UPI001CF53084|nr:hypothetical protein [Clostridium estertheticum]MCB2354719.1 hypothetical protein [Clostridium estertheticum]WAG40961.1 hypothetical protein LL065_22405 [Clostridium estertheticum]
MLKILKDRVEKGEVTIESILRGATRSKSENTSRTAREEKLFTILNSKTGSKISIANTFLEHFGNPTNIQISYDKINRFIIVGNYLLDEENRYAIRKSGNRGIIYNKLLVEELATSMGLDFRYCTSITFKDIEILKDGKYTVALVKYKQ